MIHMMKEDQIYSDTYDGYYFFSSKKALEEGITVRIRW